MQTPLRLKAVFQNGMWAGYHECSDCGKKFYAVDEDPDRPRREFERHIQTEHAEDFSTFR